MADYVDLYPLGSDSVLRQRVAIAALVKADIISDLATPTQLQIDWAKSAYETPVRISEILLGAIIGANSTATIVNITGASDAAIQTNVNDVVDNIYTKAGA